MSKLCIREQESPGLLSRPSSLRRAVQCGGCICCLASVSRGSFGELRFRFRLRHHNFKLQVGTSRCTYTSLTQSSHLAIDPDLKLLLSEDDMAGLFLPLQTDGKRADLACLPRTGSYNWAPSVAKALEYQDSASSCLEPTLETILMIPDWSAG